MLRNTMRNKLAVKICGMNSQTAIDAAIAANAANVMKNTHQLVSSTTTGAVSITPIPVSSTVHQPASSNYVQGRRTFIHYYHRGSQHSLI